MSCQNDGKGNFDDQNNNKMENMKVDLWKNIYYLFNYYYYY